MLGLSAAAATAAAATSESASTGASPALGYTYVNGNTAPVNTIDGFARHVDGSLTPLARLSVQCLLRGPGLGPRLPRAPSR